MEEQISDTDVIVGRFQSDRLRKGRLALIETVLAKHNEKITVVGSSQAIAKVIYAINQRTSAEILVQR